MLQLLLKAKIQEENVPEKHTFKCPKCGKEMILIEITKRKRAPPLIDLLPQITNIMGTIHQSSIPVRI